MNGLLLSNKGFKMVQGTLKIHTENILPIIKKWLYSDKEIFLRELVSNSCDAIRKLQMIDASASGLKIEITLDKSARTIQISDTGIGMTAEEVEKYIAQVAFSGAEEFVEKYKAKNEIIGHFGLGFYSAYMVAEKVTIDTLSFQEGSVPALWSCDGSATYTLEEGSRKERGTTITLHVDQSSDEFLEEGRLREILLKYCPFLPYPIFLNGKQINEKEPLWLKSPSSCTEEEYLDFYQALYPAEPDPIFWIHVNIDYPFTLKGILYFPKISSRFDFGKNNLKLFCSRVFVTDNCKELVPDFLLHLRGAIDSPDIPLNVSRSSLQMDRTVRQLSAHISKKVADRLHTLYQTERENFLKAWPDIEVVVKLGMLQDDKFCEKAREFLVYKTISGDWISLPELPEKTYYCADPNSHALELYKNHTVVIASTPVDTALFQHLEAKGTTRFQRIDGAVDDSLLDASREKTLLDPEGRTESSRIADFFRSLLSIPVEAKSLASDTLPALLVSDEKVRRMRQAYELAGQTLPPFMAEKKTFVVNTNSPVVSSIYRLHERDPELAKSVGAHLYELTQLAQNELAPGAMGQFAARSAKLLQDLLK